ncbi:MAG: GNAT family N-acetyltransferase [Candidatus Thorarchaeota archaeon]
MEIREAIEDDRESASRLLWRSFEPLRRYDDVVRMEWLRAWNDHTSDNWACVAVEGDSVVSNLSFFVSDDDIIRGRPIRYAGVWAVATDPVYRRKGLVRELFELAFPRMHEKGAVLSILDPFYRPFYEKFDYAIAETVFRHMFRRSGLRPLRPVGDLAVREVTDIDAEVDRFVEVQRAMTRFGSRCFVNRRFLRDMSRSHRAYILEDGDDPVGTAMFAFSDARPGLILNVRLTAFKHDWVFPSILRLVYDYSANAHQIRWVTDRIEPFRHYLAEAHAETAVRDYMMMRVLDFRGYCESINVPRDATEPIRVEIRDQLCPWNEGVYLLTPEDGSLACDPVSSRADITLNAFQLSETVAGKTPATLLRALGEIDCDPSTATALERIFPRDEFYSYYRF